MFPVGRSIRLSVVIEKMCQIQVTGNCQKLMMQKQAVCLILPTQSAIVITAVAFIEDQLNSFYTVKRRMTTKSFLDI